MAKDLLGDEVQSKPKRAKPAPVPRPPKGCTRNHCGRDADVVVMAVKRIADDRLACGPAGNFINVAVNGEWTMRSGFRFDRWICRCGKCYAKDLEVLNA